MDRRSCFRRRGNSPYLRLGVRTLHYLPNSSTLTIQTTSASLVLPVVVRRGSVVGQSLTTSFPHHPPALHPALRPLPSSVYVVPTVLDIIVANYSHNSYSLWRLPHWCPSLTIRNRTGGNRGIVSTAGTICWNEASDIGVYSKPADSSLPALYHCSSSHFHSLRRQWGPVLLLSNTQSREGH
jgi:hypothetical protein